MNETSLYTYIAVALMCVFMVCGTPAPRRTPGAPNSSGSAPVGRSATLAAAMMWVSAHLARDRRRPAMFGSSSAGFPGRGSVAFGAANFAIGASSSASPRSTRRSPVRPFRQLHRWCRPRIVVHAPRRRRHGQRVDDLAVAARDRPGHPPIRGRTLVGARSRWRSGSRCCSSSAFASRPTRSRRRDPRQPTGSADGRVAIWPLRSRCAVRLQRTSVIGWAVGIGLMGSSGPHRRRGRGTRGATGDRRHVRPGRPRNDHRGLPRHDRHDLALMISGFTVSAVLRLRTEELGTGGPTDARHARQPHAVGCAATSASPCSAASC